MVLLNIHVTSDERDMLEAAASQARTNPSDFIRRKAVEAAELEVLSGRIVTILAADWQKFEQWAKSPPKRRHRLQRLAASQPVWDN